jgi:uncharacterized integral membrane protein
MVVATTPAMAQPAAQSLSVTQARAGAELDGENDLMGGGIWAAILGIALVAALVLVVVNDDNVDLPASP